MALVLDRGLVSHRANGKRARLGVDDERQMPAQLGESLGALRSGRRSHRLDAAPRGIERRAV